MGRHCNPAAPRGLASPGIVLVVARAFLSLGVFLAGGCIAYGCVIGGCATAANGPPSTGSGGAGGGSSGFGGGAVGGGTTSSSSGGTGGNPFNDAGPFVDAGMCAAFAETFMPTCLACLATSCCSPALTCYASTDCFGYTNCQQNCPSGPVDGGNICLADCQQNYPTYEPAFGQMTACLSTSCAKTCPY
jgi:hypothetical protein